MDDRVHVISDTIQEFLGERFYLCGFYFQHKGRRLHRVVWEHFNGPIPEGYHVHHINEDRTKNDIENLSLMPGIEHVVMHAGSEARRENGRRAIKLAILAAPEWHRSEEGSAWHSEQAKKAWENVQPKMYVCTFCGKEYQSRATRYKGNHFCCQNCRAAYGRRKRAGKL